VNVGIISADGFNDMGVAETKTGFAAAVEGVYLGMPSLYGNYHGIEGGIYLRTGPGEVAVTMGFPMTFLNIGRGQPGSIRIGNSFGVAWGNIHSYAYAKPRVALVVIPDKLDIEVLAIWAPVAVSSDYLRKTLYRASAWWRLGAPKASRFLEVYAESFTRELDASDADIQMKNLKHSNDSKGITVGVGMTF
jgi:hypothetical protein